MSHAFADIAVTPAVKDTQQRVGSARSFTAGGAVFNRFLGEAEVDFITARQAEVASVGARLAPLHA